MKWFIMEYIQNGRTQEMFKAENIKDARNIAAHKAEMRGIDEWYVRAA